MHWLFLISNLLYAVFNWFVELDQFKNAQVKANSYYDEKLYLEALKVYEPIKIHSKNSTNQKLNLAHLYTKTYNYTEALKLYQTLLQTNNDTIKQICLHQIGVIYFQYKKYELSQSNIKMALNLNPYDTIASYNYELVSKMIHKQKTTQEKSKSNKNKYDSKGNAEKDVLNKKDYQKTSIDKERMEILLNYIDEMEPQRIIDYNKSTSKGPNNTTY